MTPEETSKLLATCASYDRRKVGTLDVIAWHRVIGDLQFRDCEDAVFAHYGETSDWIMPAHIRNRVKEIRKQRIQDADMPPVPPELLDDTAAWCAAVRAAATAVADGRDPESAMQAIAARTRRRELEA